MLTDHQKYLLSVSFESLFFDAIEELPLDVKIKACQAVKSLSYYLTEIETFKTHQIQDIIRQAGEVLSHPAPQNPYDHAVKPQIAISMSPRLVITKCYSDTNGKAIIEWARKGLFNLAIHSDNSAPALAEDIYVFVDALINEKLKTWCNDENILPVKTNKNVSVEKITEFNPDTFLSYTIESQLEYLGITSESFRLCDKNNLKAYQLFLRQFKIEQEKCDTIEKINTELKLWHQKCISEQKETESYIGESNSVTLNFIDIIEAKLNRFDHYAASAKPNFYTYQALKRIAFINEDFQMPLSLEPDYLDMAYLLVKFKQTDRLEEILKKGGKDFYMLHAQCLFNLYINSGSVSKKILDKFIDTVQLHPAYVDITLKEIVTKFPSTHETADYWYLIKKALLGSLEYFDLLPKEMAKEMFIEAVKRDDFEYQMLVLAQSPESFSAKALLNKESVIKLVEQKFDNAAKKVISKMFPSKLSIEDILLIEKLSQGRIKINTIKTNAALVWGEAIQPTPSPLLFMARMPVAPLFQAQAEPQTESTPRAVVP